MNRETALATLVRPLLTEKSHRLAAERGQYVFRARPNATKRSIALAVEELFGVEVASVQSLNVKGKRKRNRFGWTRAAGWKKAYVTLKPGHRIDIMGA